MSYAYYFFTECFYCRYLKKKMKELDERRQQLREMLEERQRRLEERQEDREEEQCKRWNYDKCNNMNYHYQLLLYGCIEDEE